MTILAHAILSTYRGEKRFSASFRIGHGPVQWVFALPTW